MGLDPLDRSPCSDNRIRDPPHLVNARRLRPVVSAVNDIRGESFHLRDVADGKIDAVINRAEHLPELVHAAECHQF